MLCLPLSGPLGQVLLGLSGPFPTQLCAARGDVQTVNQSWGSGPLCRSWEHPRLQHCPTCPFTQRLLGRDPSSLPRQCPPSGQGSRFPVPSGLGSTRGESQQGWVGWGLSTGPGLQLHPAQLSLLLRTVMLLWFGFTLGQPRGVPAQYIPSHPPAPSPCQAHWSSTDHSSKVGTTQGLPGGACTASPEGCCFGWALQPPARGAAGGAVVGRVGGLHRVPALCGAPPCCTTPCSCLTLLPSHHQGLCPYWPCWLHPSSAGCLLLGYSWYSPA